MTQFDKAFSDIAKLVKKFDEHSKTYLNSRYQESELRHDFLNDFWAALGWDVFHKDQTNPREQEVKIERNADAASFRKPDYTFFLSPDYKRPIFVVEAKKPSVDLSSPEYYFQAVRYGFMSSTTVAVLTDFKEFHIIDCRRKPKMVAGILSSRLAKYTYHDYLDHEKFGEIYWTFSREAVETGKLKEFWRDLKKKPPLGTGKQLRLVDDGFLAPPDDEFLEDLDRWRKDLASEFKKKNPKLSPEALTEVAQKVLDRLVFIRFLEDKEIVIEPIIEKFWRTGSAWKHFTTESRSLDRRYNGIVFKTHELDDASKIKPPSDEMFLGLCKELRRDETSYLFSIFSVEILGSIYERFLGKVVVASGRGISVQEKPEVRKAGGVYYTPRYIVDYIVENTIGRILQGKNPDEVFQLRFADIACGSGSFLLSIFDQIIHYLEKWYNDNPVEAKRGGCRRGEGDIWVLSLEQKREILQKNIYGVDIDPQAVEVAQFSLFLKLLESETIATVEEFATPRNKPSAQLTLAPSERAESGIRTRADLEGATVLPDLSKNIQLGNALVDWDIEHLFPLKSDEIHRIKPFSFKVKFKEIMDNGGFDAIVGNPPYVRNRELAIEQKSYFASKYSTAMGQYDLYQLFMEQAVKLLQPHGDLGYITSNKYAIASYGLKLREFLLESSEIRFLLDVSSIGVFKKVSTYPYIIVLRRDGARRDQLIQFAKATSELFFEKPVYGTIAQSQFELSTTKNFVLKQANPLLNRIENNSTPLGEIVTIKETIHTGNIRKKLISNEPHGKNSKKILAGKDCHRYVYLWNGLYIRYDPKLINRSEGEYANLCDPKYFDEPKILLREIALRIECCFDTEGYYALNKAYSVQRRPGVEYSYWFILALLNSKLLTYYFKERFEESHVQGGYLQFKKIYTSQIPIAKLRLNADKDKRIHNLISDLSEEMSKTQLRLVQPRWDSERVELDGKCAYLDAEIDRLVYELYGLTKEEIKIVESK